MLRKMILLIGATIQMALAKPDDDKVGQMPNVTFPTDTYSGYLTVSETKMLHYMFFESMSENAEKDPVLIWFNGGPGCSSLLGAFQENGPWVVDDNGTTYENPHPWNEKANVLYLESPAGVGYSLALDNASLSTNDM